MSEEKLTPEQVRHECSLVEAGYINARMAAELIREDKIEKIQKKCPHVNKQKPLCFRCPDCNLDFPSKLQKEYEKEIKK